MILPEQELIERSCAGDMRAFEELVSRYEKKVYSISYRFTGNHHDASDLAQETFIKVFKSLRSFRAESGFLTWVYHITANVCRDFLRKKQKVKFISFNVISEKEVQIQDRGEKELSEVVEIKETQLQLQQIICSLPEEYRLILLMREIQGFSYEEIASILKCSLGTVKSRLNRARGMFKDRYLAETSPRDNIERGSC